MKLGAQSGIMSDVAPTKVGIGVGPGRDIDQKNAQAGIELLHLVLHLGDHAPAGGQFRAGGDVNLQFHLFGGQVHLPQIAVREEGGFFLGGEVPGRSRRGQSGKGQKAGGAKKVYGFPS